MSTSLFATLRERHADLHDAALEHPVVHAIGSGTLDESTFRYYLEQDFVFLTHYVRVLARAVDAAPDLDTAEPIAVLLHSTLTVEIDALRHLYQQFGGEVDDLNDVVASPTCRAYVNHLLAVSSERDLPLILAAILPCQWGYGDIGRRLRDRGLPGDSRYRQWIEEYACEAYHSVVGSTVHLFDRLSSTESSVRLKRIDDVYRLSSSYELQFWEMARQQECWCVAPSLRF